MLKSELIKRSPIRVLDSTAGGPSKGHLGVLSAAPGVGKTSALIHIAIDKLLQGKPVIHVAFAEKAEHVLSYYEEIFVEISKVKNLEKALEVHDEVAKNRMVMTFDPQVGSVDHVVDAIKSRIQDGHLSADTVIIDEMDFKKVSETDWKTLKAFAIKENLEIWFSVSLENEEPLPAYLKACADYFSFGVNLKPSKADSKIHLQVFKSLENKPKDTHLLLDPKTLLIVKD